MPFIPPPPLKSGLFGFRGPAPAKPKPMAAAGTIAPPKPLAGVPIEHRIGVQAPAAVIWDVIYDLDRWEEWNPMYPKASGEIRIGQILDLTLVVPGQAPQQIHPVVLDWVPGDQLHWRLTLLRGMVKTTRYIEIEQLGDESCIVSNGEIFGGLMGPSIAKRMGRAVRRGFVEMNEALKARAEVAWREAMAAPTSMAR